MTLRTLSATYDLTVEDSRSLLGEYGIPMAREMVATTPDEVLEVASSLSGPLALKIIVPGVAHKSDIGGVVLDLQSPTEAHQAALDLKHRIPGTAGFLVQEVVKGSHEFFIGMRRDPTLGAFILLGLGGIWVEVMDDVAVRPVPVLPDDVGLMLDELRARPLLDGTRGTLAVDPDQVSHVVVALSRLAAEHPEVSEVDLNPLIIGLTGHAVVDRHIVCAPLSDSWDYRDGAHEAVRRILGPRSIVVIGASADTNTLAHYRSQRIPVFSMPERAVAALAGMVRAGVPKH